MTKLVAAVLIVVLALVASTTPAFAQATPLGPEGGMFFGGSAEVAPSASNSSSDDAVVIDPGCGHNQWQTPGPHPSPKDGCGAGCEVESPGPGEPSPEPGRNSSALGLLLSAVGIPWYTSPLAWPWNEDIAEKEAGEAKPKPEGKKKHHGPQAKSKTKANDK